MFFDLLQEMSHSNYIKFMVMMAIIVVPIFIFRAITLKKSVDKMNAILKSVRASDTTILTSKEQADFLNEKISTENIGEIIKECWDSFYKDFKGSKVSPDVYEYFTDKAIVQRYGNRKLAESVPAVFLSLGILGTFYGIATGMQSIDPNAPSDQLRVGISDLMSGMEIAFHSSIVGIILSLLIQFIDKGYIYKTLTTSYRILRNEMDKTFPVQTEGELLKEILEDQAVKNEGMKRFAIEQYMPAMHHEITRIISENIIPYFTKHQELGEKQVSLLTNVESYLTTQLSTQIGMQFKENVTSILNPSIEKLYESQKIQNEKLSEVNESILNELPERLKSDFTNVMENNLSPYLEKNNKIIAEMAESTKTVLHDHLNEMVNHFVNKMENMAGEQMDKLQTILIKTIDWHEKVYGELEQLVEDLQTSAEKQTKMADVSSNLSDKLQGFITAMIEYQTNAVSSINELMKVAEHNEQIQAKTGVLLEQIVKEKEIHENSIVHMVDKLINVTDSMENQANSLGNVQKEMNSLVQTYKQVETLIDKLDKSTEKQTELSDKTAEVFKETHAFANQLADYQEKTAQSAEKLCVSADKQVETHQKMHELLSGITKERMQTTENLNSQLKQFSETTQMMKEQGEMLLSLQNGIRSAIEKYESSVAGLDKLTVSNKELSSNLNQYSGKIMHSAKELEQVLVNTGKNIMMQQQIQKDMNEIVNKFTSERVQFDKLTKEEMSTLKEQLKQMDQRTKQLQLFWKENAEQLKRGYKIFENLNEKLDNSMEQFADHMYKGLDRTFTQFDKQLTTSVSYLDRGVGSIKTVVTDLEESFNEINNTLRSVQKAIEEAATVKERG